MIVKIREARRPISEELIGYRFSIEGQPKSTSHAYPRTDLHDLEIWLRSKGLEKVPYTLDFGE